MADFVEADGQVHLVSPITAGEFTLCGDAFDLDCVVEGYEQKATKKRTVTCSQCAQIIHECRGVRTAPSSDQTGEKT